MLEAEFDKFADEYRATHARNIRLSGESPDYFAEYKVQEVAAALAAHDGASALDLLDFGGGIGTSVPFFRKHLPGTRVTCADVSHRSLAVAATRFPGLAEFTPFDGIALPFPDGRFDLAFAACVFHHIEHDRHVSLLGEIHRVLRPAGRLFVFEHNPLNPLTALAVKACEFDVNARLIRGGVMARRIAEAGFAHPGLKYRVFFPKALAPLRRFERYLSGVPIGAQYYVAAQKR
ncbi:MAG TPA: class I SAM-dependent methyltransferase [Methylomirabilota bacterium]|nr:class I SAM-dependent methyltransferase [Methylomirabilota bacterium]